LYEVRKDVQCSVEHVCSTGGVVSRSLSDHIRARMTPNFVCSYDVTEIGTVATAPAAMIADRPGAVGYVAPGVTVEVVDRNGCALAPGKDGSVRIRSRHAAIGYIGDAKASKSAFRDGWFYPGDIGFLTEDSLLVIVGREGVSRDEGSKAMSKSV
jgi:long-subunit acyl-CoA synthetase (AMP-forming)